jgi:cation diffusion facilitator CzcD-associated flavoprotein CzcO
LKNIIIIGTGFAGLGMAIKLLKQGNTNFIIAERSATIGGTWRDNTYPGAACDISSHLYSFSFEPNPNWSRMFANQQEILEYTRHCVEKYGLAKYVRLNTEVTGGSFDEASGTWTLNLKDGGTLTANVVVNALGPLNRPQIPNIPGLVDFKGRVFHSSEWDHTFDYKGKKVAVVGTGASAVQIVPAIAKDVEQLNIFQRSAPWVIPKADRPMKDWERKMFRILPFTQRMLRWKWYWENELIGTLIFTRPRLNNYVQGMVVKFINKKIKDPALREKLIPDYTMGCKRITPSKEYYPALLRSNVDVVTSGINRVEGNTIFTADGNHYEADAIVLATGFKAADAPVDFVVKGRGGRILAEDWKEGPEAYYGAAVTGYPNLFFLIGPNTGLGHNSMIFVIESQVNYIMDALKKLKQRKAKFMDVKPEVQKAYNDDIQEKLKRTVWATGCRSWYIAANGRNTTVWPGLTYTFWFKTKHIKTSAFEFVK